MIYIFLLQDVEPKLHIKKHDWKKTHVNMMAAIKEAKLCNHFLYYFLFILCNHFIEYFLFIFIFGRNLLSISDFRSKIRVVSFDRSPLYVPTFCTFALIAYPHTCQFYFVHFLCPLLIPTNFIIYTNRSKTLQGNLLPHPKTSLFLKRSFAGKEA